MLQILRNCPFSLLYCFLFCICCYSLFSSTHPKICYLCLNNHVSGNKWSVQTIAATVCTHVTLFLIYNKTHCSYTMLITNYQCNTPNATSVFIVWQYTQLTLCALVVRETTLHVRRSQESTRRSGPGADSTSIEFVALWFQRQTPACLVMLGLAKPPLSTEMSKFSRSVAWNTLEETTLGTNCIHLGGYHHWTGQKITAGK